MGLGRIIFLLYLQAELERLCESERMNCFRHDNEHWRTAPLWTAGPFCFCMSASNNTYNCVRTINATHNLLYCEFVTGLVTYYNLRIGKSLLFWYLLPRLGKFLRSKVPILLSIVYIWTTAALRLANQYIQNLLWHVFWKTSGLKSDWFIRYVFDNNCFCDSRSIWDAKPC